MHQKSKKYAYNEVISLFNNIFCKMENKNNAEIKSVTECVNYVFINMHEFHSYFKPLSVFELK